MAGAADKRARKRCATRRVLTLLALIGGVFALQGLPSAAAAKGGSGSSAAFAGGGEASTPAQRRAERQAKADGAPPPAPAPPLLPPSAEAPPPQPIVAHGRHAQPPSAPPIVQSAGAHPRNEDRPATVAHGRRHEQPTEEGRSEGASRQTTSASSVAVPSAQTGAQQAEALARSKQKKGSGGQKGKKEHKGKKSGDPPPEEEGSQTEGSSTQASGAANLKQKGEAGVAAPADDAVAAAVALPTSPAAIPASGTSSATVSSLPIADVTASTPQAAGGSRALRKARKAASHARSAIPFRTAAAVVPVALSSDRPTRSSAPRAAKPVHRESTQPALVRTLTKIVSVVPTPVRILIGALILLALLLGAR
ncbi:MAG TPA: hypothetical protein VGH21_05130, partial [Solirubrobacteraceae bacterium]